MRKSKGIDEWKEIMRKLSIQNYALNFSIV